MRDECYKQQKPTRARTFLLERYTIVIVTKYLSAKHLFLLGSFRVKSPNFQEIPHDPSQMFPKKLLKIPQCVLMTQTKC